MRFVRGPVEQAVAPVHEIGAVADERKLPLTLQHAGTLSAGRRKTPPPRLLGGAGRSVARGEGIHGEFNSEVRRQQSATFLRPAPRMQVPARGEALSFGGGRTGLPRREAREADQGDATASTPAST
jgi:hypothetical protein